MEIPTEEIIEVVKAVTSGDAQHDVIEVIKAQAREILDLQATIVRLKDEHLEQRDREHLERQVDYEARRVGH
jgi:hypothetical protein